MSKPMAASVDVPVGSLFDILDEDKELVQGRLTRAEAESVLANRGYMKTSTPGLWSRTINGRGEFRKIVPYCETRRATGAD